VDASPRRREMMDDQTLDRCLAVLAATPEMATLDVTGGAPELHPRFAWLVGAARALGKRVIVRHNLTVTHDPHPLTGASLRHLPEFFAAQGVEIVSSLPCYGELNTDKQRGDGVFQKSIASLRLLNAQGYGAGDPARVLNLVYNPVGAFLPAPQAALEADYKRELAGRFGVAFDRLYTITNMPIHRFKAQLVKLGSYEDYLEKLVRAFNPAAAAGIMCRSLVSVGLGGRLYDCDFNQMLGLGLSPGAPATIADWGEAAGESLRTRRIQVGEHCFGCTAGSGSSCGGTTA
jgi:radical SAM/Cys-rich protein